MVGFSDEILDVTFVGPQNSHIAVATNSCDIKLYNINNMGCQLLKGHTDLVLTLASSLVKNCWMLSGAKVSVWLNFKDNKNFLLFKLVDLKLILKKNSHRV